jgi:transcriptional regulator with XRE-family HTH domain
MITLGQRLKEERKRLGMTQPEFAAVGKVEKNTQINYEQDKRSPTADYLLAVAKAGVDTHYVLHGQPSPDLLDADERELLLTFKTLDVRGKARMLGMLDALRDTTLSVTAPAAARIQNVAFKGDIGQQVAGDITAPQTINVGRKKK